MRYLLELLGSLPPDGLPGPLAQAGSRDDDVVVGRRGVQVDRVDLRTALDAFLASILPKETLGAAAAATARHDDPVPRYVEALNSVLNDLRNFSPHSYPFLNRVSKRDAPGYYEIIKKPMDLNKMGRNIKLGLYSPSSSAQDEAGPSQVRTGKEKFKDDLDLIWSNCFEYNTTPDHPLRREAELMRQKAQQLLEHVPDLEKDARFKQASTTSTAPTLDPAAKPHEATKGNGSQDVQMNGLPSAIADDDPLDDSDDDANADGDNEDDDLPLTELVARTKTSGAPVSARVAAAPNRKSTKAPAQSVASFLTGGASSVRDHSSRATSAQLDEGEPSRPPSPPVQHDYARPKESLSFLVNQSLLGKRKSSEEESVGRWERNRRQDLSMHVLAQRTRYGMAAQIKGLSGRKPARGSPLTTHEDDDEESLLRWASTALDPSSVANGVPFVVEDQVWDDRPGSFRPSLSAITETQLGLHCGGLHHRMTRNIARLRRVRQAYRQCLLAQEGVLPTDEIPDEMTPSEDEAAFESEADDGPVPLFLSSDPPALVDIGSDGARECMRQVIGRLCLHAGFESTHERPLQILAELACETVASLTRTLATMAHGKGRDKLPSKSAVIHNVLNQGLDQDVFQLQNYVKTDIEKCGQRLAELERRLKLKLSGLLEQRAANDEVLLAEGDMSFVDGGFLQELGEDFFGFKSLGLDREFGLTSLSVPKEALRSGTSGIDRLNNAATKTNGDHEEAAKLTAPEFVPLEEAAIDDQIGLLQSFYRRRLLSEKQLVDDELLAPHLRPELLKMPLSARQAAQKKSKTVTKPR